MGYVELDINLSKEAIAVQKEVQKFAREVMRPAGIELDKLQNPADVYEEGSAYWDVVRGYRELGLHATGFPKELGGMAGDMDPKVGPLLSEVMAHADAGLTISLSVSVMPFYAAGMSTEPVLQNMVKDYINDTSGELIGCWAITEPAHGSDAILGINPKYDDPDCGYDLTAELKGDEYVLNGQKSAWVSNGTIATHASLHLTLDPTKGMQGGGICVIPLDLPGISRGKPLDKIGQRPLEPGGDILRRREGAEKPYDRGKFSDGYGDGKADSDECQWRHGDRCLWEWLKRPTMKPLPMPNRGYRAAFPYSSTRISNCSCSTCSRKSKRPGPWRVG